MRGEGSRRLTVDGNCDNLAQDPAVWCLKGRNSLERVKLLVFCRETISWICLDKLNVEVVFLRRFDDAESGSACLCTRRCVGEQPILPADDERLDAALCTVVVDLQPAVLDVAAQIWLFLDQIIDRLAELALRRDISKRFCPRKERVQKRF